MTCIYLHMCIPAACRYYDMYLPTYVYTGIMSLLREVSLRHVPLNTR